MQQNGLIPVALIALELGADVNTIVKQFGDVVTYNNAGLRCVPAECALAHVQSVAAARQAALDQAVARQAERAGNDGVAALRRQLAARPRGRDDMSAVAVMVARDGGLDERLDDAAKHRAELTSGALTYHRIDGGR